MTINQFDRLVNDVINGVAWPASYTHVVKHPPAEHASGQTKSVKTTDDSYVIQRVLPGIKREDITVSTEGNSLTVTVKAQTYPEFAKGYSDTSWTFTLGNDADVAAADAKHVDGVLTVTVPRIVKKKRTYSIAVN